jgi:hypothetical protein
MRICSNDAQAVIICIYIDGLRNFNGQSPGMQSCLTMMRQDQEMEIEKVEL